MISLTKHFMAGLIVFTLMGVYSNPTNDVTLGEEVTFMREVVGQVNPNLMIEDSECAVKLPWAIYNHSVKYDLDWRKVFALAWQESYFDCHAKNMMDKGGAYGPFQIRRLWLPITGDPRHRYFDPELAVSRVALVLNYYKATPRYKKLRKRRFRYPLLCLYNTGEPNRVNMPYCEAVSRKMNFLERAWEKYRKDLVVKLEKKDPPRS